MSILVSDLPDSDIVSEALGEELVAVLAVTEHAYEDREEGADEAPTEELFAALQTVIFASLQTEYRHGKRQKPEPLPEQRSRNEELLHFKHEDVQPVQHLGGELQQHEEQQEVVHEDGPLQPVLVLCTENINFTFFDVLELF